MSTHPPESLVESGSLLEQLDASLPEPPKPVGSYVPVVRTGNLLYTSGTLPMKDGQLQYTGTVGSFAVPLEKGVEAAKLCALNCLSVIKAEIGSLKNIVRIIKVTGFVSTAPGFYEHPSVINGASNFLVEVFGDRGRHARAAVGVSSLPMDASVELEMVVEVQ